MIHTNAVAANVHAMSPPDILVSEMRPVRGNDRHKSLTIVHDGLPRIGIVPIKLPGC
jgi:hypothetical protein